MERNQKRGSSELCSHKFHSSCEKGRKSLCLVFFSGYRSLFSLSEFLSGKKRSKNTPFFLTHCHVLGQCINSKKPFSIPHAFFCSRVREKSLIMHQPFYSFPLHDKQRIKGISIFSDFFSLKWKYNENERTAFFLRFPFQKSEKLLSWTFECVAFSWHNKASFPRELCSLPFEFAKFSLHCSRVHLKLKHFFCSNVHRITS